MQQLQHPCARVAADSKIGCQDDSPLHPPIATIISLCIHETAWRFLHVGTSNELLHQRSAFGAGHGENLVVYKYQVIVSYLMPHESTES